MKHSKLFDTFLSNINPSAEAIGYAQEAHTRVRKCLEQDEKFKENVTGSFLYGSYKRQTAVGDIKDVDVVVLTKFDISDPENTPAKVLRKLKAALARCYDDPENPEYQRRSIRVNDPLPEHPDIELTLDIIPAVPLDGEDHPLWVPDREQKKWIQSHPKGHLSYVTGLNADDCSGGMFVPLVKIMKWWWKYQCQIRQPDVERPKPKGFWVECLTAENFDPDETSYADHFIAVLENISFEYSEPIDVPELVDPGLPTQKIKTNMELEEFEEFMDTVEASLILARLARDEKDPVLSSQLWREIFGETFPLYDDEETEETSKRAKAMVLADTSHIEPLRWQFELKRLYKVRIDAYLYTGDESVLLGGINSNGRIIRSGLSIEYEAWTNVPEPYEVYWQVVNTGTEAREADGLRGSFFEGELVQWESSLYTGKHWIQCFIVKDDRCVAQSERFYLNVKNPNYP